MSKEISDAMSNAEKLIETTYLEDKVDKLFFRWSPAIILLCIAVIAKQMVVSKAISCYTPVTIGDEKAMMSYVTQYAWVHMKSSKVPPHSIENNPALLREHNDTYTVDYYYWIYFILSLQVLLLYVPHSIWKYIITQSTGRDLTQLVAKAHKVAGSKNANDIRELGCDIVEIIRENKQSSRKCCGGKFCLFTKLRRNKLTCLYAVLMIINLGIALSQLILMMRVFGFNTPWQYFSELFGAIFTMGFMTESVRFPRKVEVSFTGIQLPGGDHTFVAQCVLPINMVCEKVVVILSLWFMLLSIIQLIKIFYWILRSVVLRRDETFIKKMLGRRSVDVETNKENIDKFSRKFLNNDIMFLIRMISVNVNMNVACDITRQLYDTYEGWQPRVPQYN